MLPSGIVLRVGRSESLLEAAHRQGVKWPTVCGGVGMCTRCVVTVEPGDSAAFSPMASAELEGLRRVRWLRGDVPGERLACQVRVLDHVSVTKRERVCCTDW
ncbi:2Fe-2S iron-sulfur cluster-binding protein [Sporichthya sp.]|uniref:2Fe-2S iron-sulfur cluster-binding protein n=1 Tax=Sporichthya sp. TaxID=65475 RepID=UPI00345BD44B